MKFATLRAVAHNIADSIAESSRFFSAYELDMYGEAGRAALGYLEIDVLARTSSETEISDQLGQVLNFSNKVLWSLCGKHGVPPCAFQELRIRFFAGSLERRFIVTIQNEAGRRSIDEYVNGKRPRILDHLGRVRKRPSGTTLPPAPLNDPA